jgi:hypothetical protein
MLKSQFKLSLIKRLFVSLFFLFGAFILPWWIVIILGLFLMFYFDNFYEFILAGLILDGLYGGLISFENFYFIFTFLTTVTTILCLNFKQKLLIR